MQCKPVSLEKKENGFRAEGPLQKCNAHNWEKVRTDHGQFDKTAVNAKFGLSIPWNKLIIISRLLR